MKILLFGKQSLLLILGLLCINFAFAEVRIYIDQPHYDLTYFESATLAVNISGLTETAPLRGYQVHLDFDDTYLEVSGLDAFSEGPFLNDVDSNPTQWYVIEENGGYTATCSILDYTIGATGAGTLFYVTLKAKDQNTGTPGTNVVLSDIILRDPLNHPITADTIEPCNIVINPGVMIYVDLSQYELVYYQSVTLAVKIQGSPDLALRGYQVHFDFNDTYLEVSGLNAFTEGPFLSDVGLTQWYVIEENGGFTATCSILDYTPGAFNSGTLFYVTLKAKDQSIGTVGVPGSGTDVLLSDIILRDPLNHPIEYFSQDGDIIIEPPLYIYTGIKVFLQGPYILGTSGNMTHILSDNGYMPLTSPYDADLTLTSFPDVSPRYIVDWIYVQLRASATGTNEQPQSCFLLNDGTVVDVDGNPELAFDFTGNIEYYTIVQHRNHLEVMSALPVVFSPVPETATVGDLTMLGAIWGGNSLGVNQIEPGTLALYSGDANQDGVIASTDNNLYWRIQSGLWYGYYIADFNLDGNVLPTDRTYYWRTNSGHWSQIP